MDPENFYFLNMLISFKVKSCFTLNFLYIQLISDFRAQTQNWMLASNCTSNIYVHILSSWQTE